MLRILLLLAALGGCIPVSGCAGGGQPETPTLRLRLPGSGWVYDVPADAPLEMRPENLAGLAAHPSVDFYLGAPPFFAQTPFFRQEFGELRSVVLVRHEPSRSSMYVDPLGGRELQRFIRIPHRPNEAYQVMTRHSPARYLLDLPSNYVIGTVRRRLSDRFPLDRIAVLPDVTVQFARTPADAVFDQIMATLRQGWRSSPLDGGRHGVQPRAGPGPQAPRPRRRMRRRSEQQMIPAKVTWLAENAEPHPLPCDDGRCGRASARRRRRPQPLRLRGGAPGRAWSQLRRLPRTRACALREARRLAQVPGEMRARQRVEPSEACTEEAGVSCEIRAAFTRGAAAGTVQAVDAVVDRWYDGEGGYDLSHLDGSAPEPALSSGHGTITGAYISLARERAEQAPVEAFSASEVSGSVYLIIEFSLDRTAEPKRIPLVRW